MNNKQKLGHIKKIELIIKIIYKSIQPIHNMMIDTKINIKNIKLYTPDYYILTNNIIDCSLSFDMTRFILNRKYKTLSKQIDDNELRRLYRLYILLNTIYMMRFRWHFNKKKKKNFK